MEHLEAKEGDHEDVMERVQSGSNSSLGGPMEETWARTAEERSEHPKAEKAVKRIRRVLAESVKVEEKCWKSLVSTRRAVGRREVLSWRRCGSLEKNCAEDDNADDLERSFIEVRNVKESAEESKWAKEKKQLKNTIRDLSKTAEKWRCRAEYAEKAIKVAKQGHVVNENGDESEEESEASEDYLSMRERLRRRSSRHDMSTDSARRLSGQEARPEKKKCSGASKWDKNSARWDEKVAKWPNGAWLERGDRKTRCSEQDGETNSGSRSSTSRKTTAETVKEVVASMNKMMRVAALPEPKGGRKRR
uniref:Uncharacterized protein n=1 Tax=Caenorhabditis japonica TaxID=281687 RepID=A0A8R1IPN4_CAEJA